jgi:hypothetical protein
VKLSDVKRGFVLLPRRWVMERSFGWMARFRRLARDYERLPTTVGGLHFVAFASLMLHRTVSLCSGAEQRQSIASDAGIDNDRKRQRTRQNRRGPSPGR